MSVYIAYTDAYRSVAKEVISHLRKMNITTWHKDDIFTRVYDEIASAIVGCTIFLFLLSESFELDRSSCQEVMFAMMHKKLLYPVRAEPGYVARESFGRLLDGLYVSDLSTKPPCDEQIQNVVTSVRALLAGDANGCFKKAVAKRENALSSQANDHASGHQMSNI